MASVKLSALISKLRDNDISYVTIPYDGSGDSGSVNIEDLDFNFNGEHDRDKVAELADMFQEDLEDFAYHILEKHYDWDWYNNDGGYGSVEIDVNSSEVSVNGYVRTTEDASVGVDIEDIDY